jgi:hypothetical protein
MNRTIRHAIASALLATSAAHAERATLFDGRSLDGWDGDAKWWRVEDGAITGGSLSEMVPENQFIATRVAYGDFDLRLKIRLTGSEGFINSGVQIRSARIPGSTEMMGYQVDAGEKWWGMLYDESRRNEVISRAADLAAVNAAVRKGDWNEYRILAEGPRIRSWINGVPALDYTEKDASIPLEGVIGIQVHGEGKALVQVKDVTLEVLPAIAPSNPRPTP